MRAVRTIITADKFGVTAVATLAAELLEKHYLRELIQWDARDITTSVVELVEVAFGQNACTPLRRLKGDIIEYLLCTFENEVGGQNIGTLVANYPELMFLVLDLASRLLMIAPEDALIVGE